MAPLTWRDTTAPSFQTSVDAQRLAGQSLNNAFGGASDALGKFHEWQQGQAATALANNLAQYPDAASENAARANGTLFNGVDRGNLTPQALGTINSNAATLLSNAVDSAKLPYVGPQAAATIQSTLSGANVNNSGAAQTQLQTRLGNEGDIYTKEGLDAYGKIVATTGDPSAAQGMLEQLNLSPKGKIVAEDALNRHYSPGGAGNPATANGANPASAALAAVPMTSSNTDGFRSAIDIPQTRNYVDKIIPNLPDMTGMTNAQKVVAMTPAMQSQESAGEQVDPKTGKMIVSSAGAGGIMQVMPKTFAAMKAAHPDITGPITDKASNILAGQYYLKDQLDKYDGDPVKALAAYNAGPGNADKWAAAAPSPVDMENTHKNLQIQAASLARSAQMADIKQNNGGIASQYSTLMKDQTPVQTLIAQNRSKENVGDPFNTIDPDLQVQGMTTVKDLASRLGVTDLSPATLMGLLKQYGSFHQSGMFTPDTNFFPVGLGGAGAFGFNAGRNSIAIHDPAGLIADITKMKDPDTLLQQNARSAGLASLTNALSDATAHEQDAYGKVLAAQRDKAVHPGRDLKPVTDLYNDTAAAVRRATDALAKAASPQTPAKASLPSPSPRARPGPPIPAAAAATSTPASATAALAAAMQSQGGTGGVTPDVRPTFRPIGF